MARFTFFVGSLLAVAPASADWVILTDGQRIQVQAVEIADRDREIAVLGRLVRNPGRLLSLAFYLIRLRESSNIRRIIDVLTP